jgi:Flp pilus assembly pilin Flp
MRPSGPARFDGAMNMQSPAAVRRLMELSNGRSVADDGQDLLEYGLLGALIAVVAIASVARFGQTIYTVFWKTIQLAFS